jgi:hypothetical protein
MKKLIQTSGVKTLSRKDQKKIKGGQIAYPCMRLDCPIDTTCYYMFCVKPGEPLPHLP